MNDKRCAVCWTAAAFAAFVVYGSLLPFDWSPLPLQAALDSYLGLHGPRSAALSYTDFATNVALFVPLALLWRACQDGRAATPISR
ncbi:MAG: hypothetical protein KGL50_11640, partial [Burkholderiales bacterium]|nr:hypothetical protein [Burkholderiales bacterium]